MQAIPLNWETIDNVAYWLVLLKHKWNTVVVRSYRVFVAVAVPSPVLGFGGCRQES